MLKNTTLRVIVHENAMLKNMVFLNELRDLNTFSYGNDNDDAVHSADQCKRSTTPDWVYRRGLEYNGNLPGITVNVYIVRKNRAYIENKYQSEFQTASFDEGKEILRSGGGEVMLSPVVFESENIDDFDSSGPITTSVEVWPDTSNAWRRRIRRTVGLDGGEELDVVYSLYMMDSESGGSPSSYLFTWSGDLWAAYFLLLTLFTLILWIMRRIRQKMKYTKNVLPKHTKPAVSSKTLHTDKISLWDSLIVVVGAATLQDTTTSSKVCSLRLLQVSLLIFSWLMTAAYNSVLVSRLTVAHANLHISLESVPRPGLRFLCTRTNSAVYSMFQMNESEDLQSRWENVVNQGPCLADSRTTVDVASNLCLQNAAVFESSNIMSRLLARGTPCQMMRLRATRVLSQISILFRKHLPYRNILKFQLMKMKNSGVLTVLEERYLALKRDLPKEQIYQEVTINHVMGIVVVYSVFVAISLLLLLMEIVIHKRQMKSKSAQHPTGLNTSNVNHVKF